MTMRSWTLTKTRNTRHKMRDMPHRNQKKSARKDENKSPTLQHDSSSSGDERDVIPEEQRRHQPTSRPWPRLPPPQTDSSSSDEEEHKKNNNGVPTDNGKRPEVMCDMKRIRVRLCAHKLNRKRVRPRTRDMNRKLVRQRIPREEGRRREV